MVKLYKERVMKILIVESNLHARNRWKQCLQSPSNISEAGSPEILLSNHFSYEVFEAQSFAGAFEIFDTIHPDIVISSLSGGLLKGAKLCHKVRHSDSTRHIGFIFIGDRNKVDSKLPVECLEMGADDYIPIQANEREILARVNAVLRMKAMTDELRQANHRLSVLSMTDELTSLHNMRSFNLEYSRLCSRCKLGDFGLGMIMIDLDNFKQINDLSNHLVGSFVIQKVGHILKDLMGRDGVPARYGGDEYVLVCSGQSPQEIMARAEEIRNAIREFVYKIDGYTVRVTSSVGASWVEPGFEGQPRDLLKAADAMLYRSKKLGRDQVSGMVLRYPVDFNHIGRLHLINWDPSSDDYHIPRVQDI